MYDPDYGPYRGHPQDPRTPEEPDRYEWESDNSPLDYMDSTELDAILSELLHGDADVARASLEKAVEARFQQHLIDQAQQDAEDIARDSYESRWAA